MKRIIMNECMINCCHLEEGKASCCKVLKGGGVVVEECHGLVSRFMDNLSLFSALQGT